MLSATKTLRVGLAVAAIAVIAACSGSIETVPGDPGLIASSAPPGARDGSAGEGALPGTPGGGNTNSGSAGNGARAGSGGSSSSLAPGTTPSDAPLRCVTPAVGPSPLRRL